ncbi:unnamed protein product [Cuscuta epithymum]|uniref:Uncharacterized protein n=1 Tax=Cuscuta epithymum TaxID=186058 RepID=A0AAV0ERD2_9ASTE|nr:unnamed protein product [Cuscuta epithymum]
MSPGSTVRNSENKLIHPLSLFLHLLLHQLPSSISASHACNLPGPLGYCCSCTLPFPLPDFLGAYDGSGDRVLRPDVRPGKHPVLVGHREYDVSGDQISAHRLHPHPQPYSPAAHSGVVRREQGVRN